MGKLPTPTDPQTSLQELKELVQNFCEERDWDQFHNPKDMAIGLITEASELLEHFRFQSPEQMRQKLEDPATREDITDELADVFFFILRFSQKEGIDLSTALRRKTLKNAERYPVEKVKGQNKKYTEYVS